MTIPSGRAWPLGMAAMAHPVATVGPEMTLCILVTVIATTAMIVRALMHLIIGEPRRPHRRERLPQDPTPPRRRGRRVARTRNDSHMLTSSWTIWSDLTEGLRALHLRQLSVGLAHARRRSLTRGMRTWSSAAYSHRMSLLRMQLAREWDALATAWHAWVYAVNESSCRVRLMRTGLSRGDYSDLAASWHGWGSDTASERARRMSLLRLRFAHAARTALAHSWFGWAGRAIRVRSLRVRVAHIARAHAVAIAWDSWATMAHESKRRGWQSWISIAPTQPRRGSAMRVLSRLSRARLARGWRAWASRTTVRTRHVRALCARISRVDRTIALLRVWRAWASAAHGRTRRVRALHTSVSRARRSVTLSHCWTAWRSRADATASILARRLCMLHLQRARADLDRGWRRWLVEASTRARRRALLRCCSRRTTRLDLTAALIAWSRHADERARRLGLARAGPHRIAHARLARGWRSFTRCAASARAARLHTFAVRHSRKRVGRTVGRQRGPAGRRGIDHSVGGITAYLHVDYESPETDYDA